MFFVAKNRTLKNEKVNIVKKMLTFKVRLNIMKVCKGE